MINLSELIKEADILNSEGCILGLYKTKERNYYLSSFLSDGTGNVFYSVNLKQLKGYLNSKFTLADLYIKSTSILVKKKNRELEQTFFKNDFIDKIQTGNKRYNTLPSSMKSELIEDKYGH